MTDLAFDFQRTAADPLNALIAIWERVLSSSSIAANDNFFDLGGDSLLALTLFHEIERQTGRSIPIAAIYDAATPAAQLALLGSEAPPRLSAAVKFKQGDDRTPLFIVHGIGGMAMELQDLGEALDIGPTIYGLQARGLDGIEPPLDRVEDMAKHDLAAIRAIQPSGPYFLAGYSFGGLIAMEIARLLIADNERVAFLGFIDSYAHPQTFPKRVRLGMRLRILADAFRSMPLRDAAAMVIARVTRRDSDDSRFAQIVAPPLPEAVTVNLQQVYDAAYAALLRYRPTFYPGRIDFFQAATSMLPVNPGHIYRPLSKQFVRQVLPGSHHSIMHADVAPLAAAMAATLRQAERA